jgi:hypothetical protein
MTEVASNREERAIQTIRKEQGIEGTTTSGFLDFIHFLLDFNIIGYTAAFVIAVSASELLNSVGKTFVTFALKAFRLSDVVGELVVNLIAFVIIVFLVFMFMYYVTMPIVKSRVVQGERNVKKLVKEAEAKDIEKTAEKVTTQSQALPSPFEDVATTEGYLSIQGLQFS